MAADKETLASVELEELTELLNHIRQSENPDAPAAAVELSTFIWNRGDEQDRQDAFNALLPIARRVWAGTCV